MNFQEFMFRYSDDDDIVPVIENSVRVSSLMGIMCKPIREMSYGFVCDLRKLYQQNPIDAMLELLNCHTVVAIEQLMQLDHMDVIYFWAWLHNEVLQISQAEASLNSNDNALEEAGVADLDKFEELNVVDLLAGGDITKWSKVREMRYEEVFAKLFKDKQTKEVAKRYEEIMTRK